MVKKCSIRGCRSESYAGCGISFFRIPPDETLRKQWLDVLKLNLSNSAVVCSRHFRREDMTIHISKAHLNKTAIPSIFPEDYPPTYKVTARNCAFRPASPEYVLSTEEPFIKSPCISTQPSCILVNNPLPSTFDEPPSKIIMQSASPEPVMCTPIIEPLEKSSSISARPSCILEINPLTSASDEPYTKIIKRSSSPKPMCTSTEEHFEKSTSMSARPSCILEINPLLPSPSNEKSKKIRLISHKHEKMQRKIKILTQRLKRRDKRIEKLEELLNLVRENGYNPDEVES